jgi:hypothetical protein
MVDVETLKINFETDGLAPAAELVEKLADNLSELAGSLAEVEGMDEDIDIDVDQAGLQRLEKLNRELDQLQRNLAGTAIGNVLTGPAGGSGGLFGDFNKAEESAAADFIGPFQFQDDSPSASADGGDDGAVADGDGRVGLGLDELRDLRETFRRDFDAAGILESDGQVTSARQVLGGSFREFLDGEAFFQALSDGDIEIGEIDLDDTDFIRRLSEEGLLDLPQTGLLNRFTRFVDDFDATKLNNIVAKLIPLLVTFVAALPAAIGGVVALGVAALGAATALASIGGLAAIGAGFGPQGFNSQRITDALQETLDDVLDALAPLAERFAPLFDQALDGIVTFVEELVNRGDALLDFRDLAKDFGGFLIETIPKVLENLVRLGQATAPIFAEIAGALSSEAFAEGVANFLGDIIPTLATLSSILVDLLPDLLALSTGFLLISSAVLGTIGTFLTLGGVIPLEAIGALIGGLLTAITVTTLYTTVNSLLGVSLGTFLVNGFLSAVAGLQTYIAGALSAIGVSYSLAAAIAAVVAQLALLTGGAILLGAGILGGGVLLDNIGSAIRTGGNFKRAGRRARSFGRTGGRQRSGQFVDVTNNVSVEGARNAEEQNRLGQKSVRQQESVLDKYQS